MPIVTGFIVNANDAPFSGKLTFVPESAPLVDKNSNLVAKLDVITETVVGDFSVTLKPGDYRLTIEGQNQVLRLTVPDQDGPFALPELLTNSLTYTGQAPPGVTPPATDTIPGKVKISEPQADPVVATVVYVEGKLVEANTYTDTRLETLPGLFLPLAGGVMAGELQLSGTPVMPNGAVPKDYVDTAVAQARDYIESKSAQDRIYTDDAITLISLTPGPQGPAGATGPQGATGANGAAWSPAVGTLAYATSLGVDFSASQFQVLTLTGDVAFSGSTNRAAGKTTSIRLVGDASQRNLTFPAGWKFIGAKPASLAAGKEALLSLTCYGANESDVRAVFAAEQ